MQFGLFGSAQASTSDLGPETGQGFRDYLDYNVEAEALGYRSSFLVEHHFTGWNQVSATLKLLTWLAMRTTTLRLGTAVIVLPWHNPVLLAEQAATLDLLSGGRLDFGIGKGYRHNEFAGFRIPMEEAERALRGMRSRSSPRRLDLARALLASRAVLAVRRHRGRAAAGAEAASAVLGGGRQRASIRRAAARGFKLILDQYASPEQIGRRIAIYRAELASRRRRSTRCTSRSRASSMSRKTRPRPAAALERAGAQQRAHGRVSRLRRTARPARMSCPMRTSPARTDANAMYGTPDEICRDARGAARRPARIHHFHDARRPRAAAALCARHHAGVFAASGPRAVQSQASNARLKCACSGLLASCHRRNPLRR